MKVIRLASGEDPEGGLRRLAAEMLNLEAGAVAFGPALEPLPGPWAPYPLVEVPPVTDRGLGCQVHYQPASGVVYYTRRAGDSPWAWALRLKELLAGAGTGHLERPRVVAATPQGVFRARARVSEWNRTRTRIADPSDEAKQAPAYREIRVPRREDLGSERLTYSGAYKSPPAASAHAVFAWHFEPAVYLALLGAGVVSFDGDLVNAMVAGILFDVGGASALGDGDVTLDPAGVFPQPLAPFPSWGPEGLHYRVNAGRPSRSYGSSREGLLLLEPSGEGPVPAVAAPLSGPPPGAHYRVIYVGHSPGLEAPAGKAWGSLPEEPWDPATLLRPFACILCETPIGGPAVLVRGARYPEARQHPGRPYCGGGPKRRGPIVPAACPRTGALLCRQCWNRSCDLGAHLGARVGRTVVPLAQAASGACVGLCEGAIALLSGRAYPVEGVPGAFVVFLGEVPPCQGPVPPEAPEALEGVGLAEKVAAECRGRAVLITGATLGPSPSALLAELARLALPALGELRIAVARPA